MSSKKHLQPSLIPKSAASLPQQTTYLNKKADFVEGWQRSGDEAIVLVSIKLLQSSYQCFSDWDKAEMRAFWAFNDKIHQYTWRQVFSTASKTPQNKTGIAYTIIEASQYPDSAFKESLDPQTTFFELRVTDKARVHGFRSFSIFYLCWLDRNHEICS